jgi:GAG-pre-integrase domain
LSIEYDSLIVSLNSKSEAVPFNELAGLLLTHEQRIQKHALINATTSSASIPSNISPLHAMPQANLVASTDRSSLSDGALFSQFQAFLASKHGSWRGKTSLTASSSTTDVSDRPTCQLCFKKGHTADRCYKRFVATYRPQPPRPPFRYRSPSPQALFVQPDNAPPETWYLDSGASAHVTPDLSCFTSYQPYTGSDQLRVGDGKGLQISNIGTTCLVTRCQPLVLNNVLHVPSISKPLLSISQLVADNAIIVEFNSCSCFIKDRATQQILLQGLLRNGLYTVSSQIQQLIAFNCDVVSLETWHHRLAHASTSVLQHILSSKQIACNSRSLGVCESCSQSKSHKQPFPSSLTTATKSLELVHCDLWGPSPIVSHNGLRYYILFTDHFSRFNWIFFCANKSEVALLFENFKSLVQNLFSTTIKTLQIDGGTEFLPIIRTNPQINFQISCPYTPQQNGLVERRHRHIVELGLATMFNANIPMQYWSDVFESVTFIINRLPSSALEFQTPYQLLFNKPPDYKFFKTIGCKCYPYTRPYSTHKLSPRSKPCVFIGYSSIYKGYKYLDLRTNRIYISRHVIFDEQSYPFKDCSQSQPPTASSDSLCPLKLLNLYSHPLSPPTTPSLPPIPPVTQIYYRRRCRSNALLPLPAPSPQATNSHHMITRAKSRLPNTQQHALLTTKHPVPTADVDPTTFTQASK